ncbi:M48 family metalloprotease [Thermasporomyces composti]|uniref:STE24 endopeptidase n=1 Tax=Thermasporomyces composti TaxID=696763 RepID=A0A3D9V0D8_THECX|nr:M48 family metalloprotease [Thermasporomyces composti]REF34886.1 STE24 endopeptidase [Thermasporomyces composti]
MDQRGRRRAHACLAMGMVLTVGVALVLLTPWRLSDDGTAVTVPRLPLTADFTPAEIEASRRLQRLIQPPAYLTTVASTVLLALLGLTGWGSRLCAVVTRGVRVWWVRVALGSLALLVVVRLAVLPFDVWLELARRHVDASTHGWGAWARDLAAGFALVCAVVVALLLTLVGLARRFPRWWCVPAAVLAGLAVAVGSAVYPVVVEPLQYRFTPLPPGGLRSSLLELAERDGIQLTEVLVADASRRTTRVNAYVSGVGPTWRLVLYDTLLEQATPEQIRLIVAHELGHARRHDVARGTALGALAAVAGVVVLGYLLDSRWLTRRARVRSAADPRAVALVLALVAVGALVAAPIHNLVSRRVEARADVHALDLTRDPAGYARVHRWLAVTNRSDLEPSPVLFGWFATHPAPPHRLGVVRWWVAHRGEPQIPALAGQ